MKSTVGRMVAVILSALCLDVANSKASGEDYDAEISKVANELVAVTGNAGLKKIAVLDFVDIQGNASDMGRFVAEQVSLGMVMQKRSFSIMDRSNLNRIMEEHKLTMSGLIAPENAKKLGQFANVDALIIGNITTVNDSLVVGVKVIATETAEIIGATKAKFNQKSLGDPSASSTKTVTTPPGTLASGTYDGLVNHFGLFDVRLTTMQRLQPDVDDNPRVLITFVVHNTSTESIIVGLDDRGKIGISDNNGNVYGERHDDTEWLSPAEATVAPGAETSCSIRTLAPGPRIAGDLFAIRVPIVVGNGRSSSRSVSVSFSDVPAKPWDNGDARNLRPRNDRSPVRVTPAPSARSLRNMIPGP